MKRAEEKKWIVDGLSWVEMGKKEKKLCAAAVGCCRGKVTFNRVDSEEGTGETLVKIYSNLFHVLFFDSVFFSFFSLPPLPPQCSLFVHESRLVEVLKQLVGGRLQAAKEVAETTFQTRTQKKNERDSSLDLNNIEY